MCPDKNQASKVSAHEESENKTGDKENKARLNRGRLYTFVGLVVFGLGFGWIPFKGELEGHSQGPDTGTSGGCGGKNAHKAPIRPGYEVGTSPIPIPISVAARYAAENHLFTSSHVDITPDGAYAAVGFESKSQPEKNHVRIMQYVDRKWVEDQVIFELPKDLTIAQSQRNVAAMNERTSLLLPVRLVALYQNSDGDYILSVGGLTYIRGKKEELWSFDASSLTKIKVDPFFLTKSKLATPNSKLKVMAELSHSIKPFIDTVRSVHPDINRDHQEKGFARSVNNWVLLNTQGSVAYLIPPCRFGSELQVSDDLFSCVECRQEKCHSIFLTQDVLALSLKRRDEMTRNLPMPSFSSSTMHQESAKGYEWCHDQEGSRTCRWSSEFCGVYTYYNKERDKCETEGVHPDSEEPIGAKFGVRWWKWEWACYQARWRWHRGCYIKRTSKHSSDHCGVGTCYDPITDSCNGIDFFGNFNVGTVTDPQTCLTWMKCPQGMAYNTNSNKCENTGRYKTFWYCDPGGTRKKCDSEEADLKSNEAFESCNSLNSDGRTGWRIPSIDELKTVMQCTDGKTPSAFRGYDPDADDGYIHNPNFTTTFCGAGNYTPTTYHFDDDMIATDFHVKSRAEINRALFPPNFPAERFWTSSVSSYTENAVYSASFVDGDFGFSRIKKDDKLYLLCVSFLGHQR